MRLRYDGRQEFISRRGGDRYAEGSEIRPVLQRIFNFSHGNGTFSAFSYMWNKV